MELWLAVVFVLVLVCCWRLRATWLPRAVLASGAAVLLGLAAINPDGVIARYNVYRYEATGKLDVGYASGLSADAAGALAELPADERNCVLGFVRWSDPRERSPLAWNVGRARGAGLAEGYDGDPADCPEDPEDDGPR